ncbi:MAG: hypothetical protein OXQ28_11595 [Acidobacteriota bacterium]|nr:hypothetical protein [Acidobacteriota bacterium]
MVGSDDAFPHAELDEDVRRHVQGVGRGGRDFRVRLRGRQGQDRVLRVVEGVNDEMRRARMVRVAREHVQGNGSGAYLPGESPVAAAHGAEKGEGVQRRDFVVFGIGLVQAPHGLGIRDVPGELVAGTVEDVHRFH